MRKIEGDLAAHLPRDGHLEEREGIHIFDLDARAKSLFSFRSDGDVRIDPQASFFHIAVASVEIEEDRPDRLRIGRCFLRQNGCRARRRFR